MKPEIRKAIVVGTAHVQHALRLRDLPYYAAGELLQDVKQALEGNVSAADHSLVECALKAVEATNKAHRKALNKG